jgi:hypothetical protein
VDDENSPPFTTRMTTMTDEEILAHYRLANPYISLQQAKALHRIELKFGHLSRRDCQRDGGSDLGVTRRA